MTEAPFDHGWFLALTSAPTLGVLIEQELVTRDCSRKELAFALGMPYEKFQRVKADIDLPTSDELDRMILTMRLDPIRVEHNLKASIYKILWRTLYAMARPSSTLRAARRRGTETDDAAQIRVEDLPLSIRRVLGAHFDVGVDDARGMAAKLRRKSGEDADAHARFIKGVAAQVELEGEETSADELRAIFEDVTREELEDPS